jgi:hypothetical protein
MEATKGEHLSSDPILVNAERSEAVEREVQSPSPPVRCVACAGYHGSINAEFSCLRREILRLRSLGPVVTSLPGENR